MIEKTIGRGANQVNHIRYERRYNMHKGLNCILILLCIIVVGCISENYSFTLFSYPPGSEPHDNTWVYWGAVRFYYDGAIRDYSEKRIVVKIDDRSEKKLLDDFFKLNGGYLGVMDIWNVFDTLTLLFYDEDVGEPVKVLLDGASDSTYANVLLDLRYVFNSKIGLFERQ